MKVAWAILGFADAALAGSAFAKGQNAAALLFVALAIRCAYVLTRPS